MINGSHIVQALEQTATILLILAEQRLSFHFYSAQHYSQCFYFFKEFAKFSNFNQRIYYLELVHFMFKINWNSYSISESMLVKKHEYSINKAIITNACSEIDLNLILEKPEWNGTTALKS